MKKNVVLVIFFMFIFLISSSSVYAAQYKATIQGTGVSLRTGAGTSYSKVSGATLVNGGVYTLISNTPVTSTGTDSCDSKSWYQISYDGSKTGYVCSTYVSVSTTAVSTNATSQCESELSALGFPSSYWAGLCAIKAVHPNWTFSPVQTNLDWATAVSKESSCGKSYISSTLASNINPACKNPYTKTRYPASSTAVARNMDPRNFFSEKGLFQFEGITFNSQISSSYLAAVDYTLKNALFYQYHIPRDFKGVLNNSGSQYNVSPLFLASRMKLEMGSKNALYDLYSGVYPGYEGYYNFFNMGVTDTCANTYGTTYCGLNYAKDNGFYGLQAALNGGASFIANKYVAKGQYTNYFQKYNVKPSSASSLYLNQYMTNIEAPSSEGSITYNTYKALGLLNSAFTFYIPVYSNMGNTNYVSDGATGGNTTSDPSTTAISTLIVSSGYKTSGNFIMGIAPGTTSATLKATIESVSGSNTVTVPEILGTGAQITIRNASGSATYSVIINGDASGDGIINALDLLLVQKSILKAYNLSGVYAYGGDTNDDGKVDALDLLQIQKSILGAYTIMQ